MTTRPEHRRARAGTALLLIALLAVACSDTTGSRAEMPRRAIRLRSTTLPAPQVDDWTRATLVGGPDRIVVAEPRDSRTVRETDLRYRVQEFDPSTWRWRQRPDAAGVPIVLRDGLVAVSLRCGPSREGNARCDIVGHVLPDGSQAWRSERISDRREWVHEGEGSVVLGVTDQAAVVRVYRSSLRYFAVSVDGFESLPRPQLRWAGAPKTSQYAHEEATCLHGRRFVRVTTFGAGSVTPPQGEHSVAVLDLDRRRWSPERTVVGPAGSGDYTPFGCRRDALLAFESPSTLGLTPQGWVEVATGTPPMLNRFEPIVSTSRNLVVTTGTADGRGLRTVWLNGGRWHDLPEPDAFVGTSAGSITHLGEHVVGLRPPESTPTLEVLQPGAPLSG